MNCIVKEHSVSQENMTMDHFMAELIVSKIERTPLPLKTRSIRYKNTESGREYLCLSGGFAWPAAPQPGFALVLAAEEAEDPETPAFRVVAEVESQSSEQLVRSACELSERYGANCNVIRWAWYGNQNSSFNDIAGRINDELRRQDKKTMFFLQTPDASSDADRFALYSDIVLGLVRKTNKRLFFDDNDKIKGWVDTLIKDVNASQMKDHPAILALGFVLNGLLKFKPWTWQPHGLEPLLKAIAEDDNPFREENPFFQDSINDMDR